ncbi:uncharacterized protein [Drosophila pseudoobscura]|uniref:Alpha Karyopherin-5B n=1 Tax=Drosophila pseudoobscura pseudoobscura TaxID=46245 RepID=A0A6I8VYS4_DROPS|nr:uncharacterized protein LOC6903455 [Drosophila pseudoobscura]XP_015035410.2 uncharacterized protein LOC6903455 [Drosophila pseudoobscura]XP_033236251.1 uncharacterized protein LOC6903455 [Drosophila pseudoobscura]
MDPQFFSPLCDLSRQMGLISQDQLNIIYDHLAIFELLDNDLKSAQNYGDWILSNMDICWRGRLIETLFFYLEANACQRDPDNAVKALRVLYHVTTYCTEIKMQHISMFSNLFVVLKVVLELTQVQDIIVDCTLDLVSNFLFSSWMIRDAIESSGLLSAMLNKLDWPPGTDVVKQNSLIAKIGLLLYQFLRHKTPGPAITALEKIAKTLAALLSVNQDLTILMPLLKLTRLVAEHQSATERVMIKTGLFANTASLVQSPLYEVKYEAIFILANTCQLYGRVKRHNLHRLPPSTLRYIHHLFRHRCMKIRIMALHLLTGITDNRAIDPSLMCGIMPMVIRCASELELEVEVRVAAGWTLASLTLHLNVRGMAYFVHSGGVHAMCYLLKTVQELPIQLIRNILTAFIKIWESYRYLASHLVNILRECGIMDGLQQYMDSPNHAVRTLATLLKAHKGYDICWVEVLAMLNID